MKNSFGDYIDKKAWKWTIIIIIICTIFYIAYIIYSGTSDVIDSFIKFNLIYIPIILFLSFIAYVFRAIRWHYYLRELGINLTIKETFILYFASLAALIVPFVLSGIIKAGFIKMKTGAEISKTLPIVFIERITDLIGMVVIASICFLFINFEILGLIKVILFLIGFIGVIQSKRLIFKFLGLFENITRLEKLIQYVKNAYESAYIMLRPKPLFVASILSIASWSFAGVCMYLIILGLDIDLSIWAAIFVFIFPSIIGVITQVPGGIGAEEIGIYGLLTEQYNVDTSNATAAMLLMRGVTLWYGMVIGFIGLRIFSKKYSKTSNPIEKE